MQSPSFALTALPAHTCIVWRDDACTMSNNTGLSPGRLVVITRQTISQAGTEYAAKWIHVTILYKEQDWYLTVESDRHFWLVSDFSARGNPYNNILLPGNLINISTIHQDSRNSRSLVSILVPPLDADSQIPTMCRSRTVYIKYRLKHTRKIYSVQ